MKILEELETKVIQLVQTNRELQGKVNELKFENERLVEQHRQYETSLSKESGELQALVAEKAAIKGSIEALLSNISAIENAQ
jgi:FtsZ-binding cell division protein ZapB